MFSRLLSFFLHLEKKTKKKMHFLLLLAKKKRKMHHSLYTCRLSFAYMYTVLLQDTDQRRERERVQVRTLLTSH